MLVPNGLVYEMDIACRSGKSVKLMRRAAARLNGLKAFQRLLEITDPDHSLQVRN